MQVKKMISIIKRVKGNWFESESLSVIELYILSKTSTLISFSIALMRRGVATLESENKKYVNKTVKKGHFLTTRPNRTVDK